MKRHSSWSDLHFGPFPLEKINKRGAKKVENQPPPNIHLKPRMIWYHKGNVAILLWDEKRLCLGSGGLKCESSVPKFERESHPDHWGGPIDPKLCGTYSYVYQT